MFAKVMRRLSPVVALSLLAAAQHTLAEDYLPPDSAFRSIGYTIQDPAVMTPPAAVPNYATVPIGLSSPVAPASAVGPACGVPAPACGVPEPSCAAPACGAPAPSCGAAAPTCGAAAPTCGAASPSCGCVQCTEEKKKELAAKAKGAHKPLFYLNDFSYLQDPCYDGHLLGDGLKQLGGPGFLVDLGGQYRARVHREENHRGLGITGGDDDFLLHRLRLYMNAKIGQNVRVFAETLHADSNYESLGIRPIEENHFDLQNLFVDLTLLNGGGSKLVARAGRQEIALGAQRYVSPLDWANTRRTFDGGRLMYSNDTWNIDAFWLRPTIRDFRSFDETNDQVEFYGIYGTNKAPKNGAIDLYWIGFDTNAFEFDSIGARYNGTAGGLLFETEGAYQFGTNPDDSDHSAGFFMAGLGKKFTEASCSPTSWVYIDWASGDDAQAAGNGHHHFQPLAHKYNGFMDLYGRRNLVDFNILTTLQIAPKVKALLWYHNFWLANENDTPYSVTMAPQQAGVTPADAHLGNELDFVLTLGINARSNVLFGYSRFWAGDYYDSPGLTTRFGGPLTKDTANANFYYCQYTLNF